MSWDDHMDEFDAGRKMLLRTYGMASVVMLAMALYYGWEFYRAWRAKL